MLKMCKTHNPRRMTEICYPLLQPPGITPMVRPEFIWHGINTKPSPDVSKVSCSKSPRLLSYKEQLQNLCVAHFLATVHSRFNIHTFSGGSRDFRPASQAYN